MMKYTKDHEWVSLDGDIATVGVTYYAVNALGDIVYVELPEIGQEVKAGDSFAVVESVKAASDVYAPISGIVKEVNYKTMDESSIVNSDPEGEGWFAKIKIHDISEYEALMTLEEYSAITQ
jgi:glycine cleavage system H protein